MSMRSGAIAEQILEQKSCHPLLNPEATLLASMLESRRDLDSKGEIRGALPPGVMRNLRPPLPRIDIMALRLFTERKAVESFPLIYTTLAMAHPN
jgi:hypothetical protein